MKKEYKDLTVEEQDASDFEDWCSEDDEELDPDQCEWCCRHEVRCGKLFDHKNKNYSGRFCRECIWLSDQASEAVENDES